MLVQTFYPKEIAPERYDAYLASGWFRGANMLYKTDMLCIAEDIHSVINIRLPLEDLELKKRHRKLLRQNDKLFRVEIGPLKLDSAREQLYRKQKHRFKGFVHDSLVGYLYGGEPRYVFNSLEVAVYDGEQLIAWSCMDQGKKALASLIGLHDPEYKRFSLGIYTMLIELSYARDRGFSYYYPGYVLDTATFFDYKLELGDYQHYTGKYWKDYTPEVRKSSEAELLREKTKQMLEAALQLGMLVRMEINPYFTLAYLNQYADDLEGYPMYVKYDLEEELSLHMCFDVNSSQFILHQVAPVYDTGISADPHLTNEYNDLSTYCAYPPRVVKRLAKSTSAMEVLEKFYELYQES